MPSDRSRGRKKREGRKEGRNHLLLSFYLQMKSHRVFVVLIHPAWLGLKGSLAWRWGFFFFWLNDGLGGAGVGLDNFFRRL